MCKLLLHIYQQQKTNNSLLDEFGGNGTLLVQSIKDEFYIFHSPEICSIGFNFRIK
jgi:hypothetical protein